MAPLLPCAKKNSHAPVLLLPQLRNGLRQLLRASALLLLQGARKRRARGALNLRAQLGRSFTKTAVEALLENRLLPAACGGAVGEEGRLGAVKKRRAKGGTTTHRACCDAAIPGTTPIIGPGPATTTSRGALWVAPIVLPPFISPSFFAVPTARTRSTARRATRHTAYPARRPPSHAVVRHESRRQQRVPAWPRSGECGGCGQLRASSIRKDENKKHVTCRP